MLARTGETDRRPGATKLAMAEEDPERDMNSSSHRSSSDYGVGVIGLLITIGTLGVLAVLAVLSIDSSTKNVTPQVPGVTSNSGSASGAGSATRSAAVIACRTDYQAITQAVAYYEERDDHAPTTLAALGSILKDIPSSAFFTISIDPHQAGQVDVATKGFAPIPGDANCSKA